MQGEASPTKKRASYSFSLEIFRRRSKTALILLLLAFGSGYYLWATFLSGRVILIQQASAEEITRGKLFGPVYLGKESKTVYGFKVKVPSSEGIWETKIEILDEHLRVIHPQSDLIILGERTFEPSEAYSKRSAFKLKEGGKYFLRFTQLNGTFASTSGSNGGETVMTFYVKTGLVDRWGLWLPIIISVVLILGVIVLL